MDYVGIDGHELQSMHFAYLVRDTDTQRRPVLAVLLTRGVLVNAVLYTIQQADLSLVFFVHARTGCCYEVLPSLHASQRDREHTAIS